MQFWRLGVLQINSAALSKGYIVGPELDSRVSGLNESRSIAPAALNRPPIANPSGLPLQEGFLRCRGARIHEQCKPIFSGIGHNCYAWHLQTKSQKGYLVNSGGVLFPGHVLALGGSKHAPPRPIHPTPIAQRGEESASPLVRPAN